MLPLLLGVAALVGLMFLLGKFSGTQIATMKSLGLWVVLIGGVLLAVMLLLTGRAPAALGDVAMLGIVLWPWLKQMLMRKAGRFAAGGFGQGVPPRAAGSGMSRDEALSVLGLKPGADEAAIRDAHKRLMRMAHPDNGGSDWLASRLNQARDTLLG
jgi:DnaJ family protein C protein 19